MSESVDRKLHRAVGLSDLAALLAAGFSFPNEQIAQALSDGRTVYNKLHWSGSDNQRLRVSAYPAPEIDGRTICLRPRK